MKQYIVLCTLVMTQALSIFGMSGQRPLPRKVSVRDAFDCFPEARRDFSLKWLKNVHHLAENEFTVAGKPDVLESAHNAVDLWQRSIKESIDVDNAKEFADLMVKIIPENQHANVHAALGDKLKKDTILPTSNRVGPCYTPRVNEKKDDSQLGSFSKVGIGVAMLLLSLFQHF